MPKCVLPFIRYDYQAKSPCCILSDYNHERDNQKLLEDHRAGIKSKFCNRCWKTEDIGKKSKRQEANKFFKEYSNEENVKIVSLVIPTGNVCNLSCVTCGPHASSGWKLKYNFMKTNNNIFKNNNTYNLIPEELKREINWGEINDVEFLGGETLMSKNIWQFLDLLNKKTTISLLTNGTVKLKEWQINKLKEKENLHICFSIDGFDKIFEFLRQPAKWEDVYKNILEYKKYFGINKLSYNVTVGNINIFYIDEILKKLIKILPTKSSINFIEHPIEFSILNLTNEQGKIVESRNPFFFKKKKENITWANNKEFITKFIYNIKLQEQFSKIYIKDYLPEYYELIKEQYLRH
jgi:hypothetical protein